ncbi:MAG TPA: YbhB/YbcL family Raf kinase inhibitor-like protein [Planctomycetota bacterium]|nr:YbhB/YbcL family Raf kinase inhibitor-like protein [Planctomycetota bacterium]
MTMRHKVPSRKDRATHLQVSSPSFHHGERIPVWHSMQGGNESPELSWSELPGGTVSLAVICEDPDAAGQDPFVHWLAANVHPVQPGDGLPRGVGEIPGAVLGRNNFNRVGYDGPAPPPGKIHHYHFRIYALDSLLNLEDGFTRLDLIRAIQGHVLATGDLMGTYSR